MSMVKIGMPRVVNIKREPCTFLIVRPSPWGTPELESGEQERVKEIRQYHQRIMKQPDLILALPQLAGEILGCYCKPKPCHGDVLVRLYLQYELYCVQRTVSELKQTLKYGQRLHTLVQSLNQGMDRENAIAMAIGDHRRLYPWIEEWPLVVPERRKA